MQGWQGAYVVWGFWTTAAALQVVLIGCLIALMLVLRPKGIWGEKLASKAHTL
jgi:branched-chain amino acid transport system permease protein